MDHLAALDPALAGRLAAARAVLGPAADDLMAGALAVGQAYLPGDEDLVFGFVQRVLARLKQEDRGRGLLFPKYDAGYRRLFDYVDADGTIWVLRPGDGPGEVPHDPAWFRTQDVGDPERSYHEVVPGAAASLMLGFLEAWAALRARAGSR